MKLTRLDVIDLRNILSGNIHPGPYFNIIFGQNGSGKSSILEAIYLLAMGRSFRTHLTNRIINNNANKFTVFGAFLHDNGLTTKIGIEKNRQGHAKFKINEEIASSAADLINLLPIQFINHESHQLLDSGPKFRRQFLDWGVFHVEHRFFHAWKQVDKLLKQRNSALKQHYIPEQIKIWDDGLAKWGSDLNQLRQEYLLKFYPLCKEILGLFFDNLNLEFNYYPGWPESENLRDLLHNNLNKDLMLGNTQIGPHRADLRMLINNIPVHDVLSRGQQKLLVCALRLAQGMLLKQITSKSCLYLLDDLPAELDELCRERVINLLNKLQSQVFITSIAPEDVAIIQKINESPMFHVEHGQILTPNVCIRRSDWFISEQSQNLQ